MKKIFTHSKKQSIFLKALLITRYYPYCTCVECNNNFQKRRFLYFQSRRFYRSNGTCGVRLCSCYPGRPLGASNILSKCHTGDFLVNHMRQVRGAVLNISVVADEDCEIIFLNVQKASGYLPNCMRASSEADS